MIVGDPVDAGVFGAVGYGAAALAFTVLTLLLATSWRGRAQGARLIAAAAVTAGWAATLALLAWGRPLPLIVIYTLEVLRGGAWIMAGHAGAGRGDIARAAIRIDPDFQVIGAVRHSAV